MPSNTPRSSSDIQEDIDQVNQKRATLATNQPAGWRASYAVLQNELTELTREWMAARQSEEAS